MEIELEKKSVSLYDIAPNIYVSTVPSLDTILNWYKGKIYGKTSIGWELQKKTYEIYQNTTIDNAFNLDSSEDPGSANIPCKVPISISR